MARVLPDEAALDKEFDYEVPAPLAPDVRVGTAVRAPLHGRRIGGWVVELGVEPPAGVSLRQLTKISGWGPPREVFDLAEWAAWRWAGRRASFLRTASAERNVRALPPPPPRPPSRTAPPAGALGVLAERALDAGGCVMRVAPGVDTFPVVLEAARRGPTLVLAPTLEASGEVHRRLRASGVAASLLPAGWAAARRGGTVVGARGAAWAPMPEIAAVIVLDEHDEAWQQEQAPTWHARDVALERARRSGAPALLVSPMPSLEAEAWGPVLEPSRSEERSGWPMVDVVDMREEEPRLGLISRKLAHVLSGGLRVACVLNRRGRARLLVCASCGEVAGCEECGAAVAEDEAAALVCPRCGVTRPKVCTSCGGSRMRGLRPGVSRLREDLQAIARTEVAEVTGEGGQTGGARIHVGTEALLHQLRRGEVDVVAFLDLDQELLAPRYRAAEEALALLVRASRVLGGRDSGGRLLLQTRLPGHEVVQAALHADPSRVAEAERGRRRSLGYPPATALAVVSGPAAAAFLEGFGSPLGVEILGPSDGAWMLRSDDRSTLLGALAAAPRPGGRLRIAVDPMRL